jgi:hypothetical protein
VITDEHRKNLRVAAVKDRLLKHGKAPNYNPYACRLIDQYGLEHGYKFRHAENGGEVYLKEIGYWLDGYDNEKNVAIEVNERRWHTNKERDEKRKTEIIKHLNCKLIEIWID